MLMALLKGKLSREQENMEDILTSTVFGLLKYEERISQEAALLPFLRRAETLDGDHPLAVPVGTRTGYGGRPGYEFWPGWKEDLCAFCEPDVVLRLVGPDGSRKLVSVEAKFRSGISSQADDIDETPPAHQLAREWDNLFRRAETEAAVPVLVYLTAYFGIPHATIEGAQAELAAKGRPKGTIAWLSWRHLDTALASSEDAMLVDLRESLRRLDLSFFNGVPVISAVTPITWSFGRCAESRFRWAVSPVSVYWSFRPQRGLEGGAS